MVTVSNIVRKYIDDSPFVAEGLLRGIISHPGLAEELQPKLERELGKKVKLPAIIMALRRCTEDIEKQSKHKHSEKVSSELSLKTGLCVIGIRKSPSVFKILYKAYHMVDYERGDTLNVSHGNTEVSIIFDEKYKDKILELFKGEKILKRENNLVALTILFSKEYFNTPGTIFSVVRKIAWHNINIVELISANSELSIIINKDDATKAYGLIQDIMK